MKISIALDPFLVNTDPLWSAEKVSGKHTINVATEDPNFHLNSWYFVVVEWTDGIPAQGWLRLRQQRSVSLLANGIPKKMQFLYDRELVKFAAFPVPAKPANVTVEIEGLSPYIQPTVYLKHIEVKTAMMDLDELDYPSMQDFEYRIFDDYTATASLMTYSFSVEAGSEYGYFTMAIF